MLGYNYNMPICKKCNTRFKSSQIVNGKIRNLGNRKYCLVCSPFGGHNTQKLELCGEIKTSNSGECELVVCSGCGREYEYDRRKGHRRNKCNSCISYDKYRKVKKAAIEYKGGKCSVCGYSKCIDAMVFHHRNPEEKDFNIGGNYNRSWKTFSAELDKCDLMCGNCHAEKHCKDSNR